MQLLKEIISIFGSISKSIETAFQLTEPLITGMQLYEAVQDSQPERSCRRNRKDRSSAASKRATSNIVAAIPTTSNATGEIADTRYGRSSS